MTGPANAPDQPSVACAARLHIDYADFTADPVGTVDSVYAHFGLPYSGAAADAIRGLHAAAGRDGGLPAHRYSLADFGLSAEQVTERFGGDKRG